MPPSQLPLQRPPGDQQQGGADEGGDLDDLLALQPGGGGGDVFAPAALASQQMYRNGYLYAKLLRTSLLHYSICNLVGGWYFGALPPSYNTSTLFPHFLSLPAGWRLVCLPAHTLPSPLTQPLSCLLSNAVSNDRLADGIIFAYISMLSFNLPPLSSFPANGAHVWPAHRPRP